MTTLVQVLEVHEQLEQPIHEIQDDDDLDDTEKAIVREMCNVCIPLRYYIFDNISCTRL